MENQKDKEKDRKQEYYNLLSVLYYLENIKSGTKDIIWDLSDY